MARHLHRHYFSCTQTESAEVRAATHAVRAKPAVRLTASTQAADVFARAWLRARQARNALISARLVEQVAKSGTLTDRNHPPKNDGPPVVPAVGALLLAAVSGCCGRPQPCHQLFFGLALSLLRRALRVRQQRQAAAARLPAPPPGRRDGPAVRLAGGGRNRVGRQRHRSLVAIGRGAGQMKVVGAGPGGGVEPPHRATSTAG